MKITEIQVDRFGVWRNVAFPLHGNGLTVVYGPNEAGKSTLLRFIRSVLYGYEPLPHTSEPGLPFGPAPATHVPAPAPQFSRHSPLATHHSAVWEGSLGVVHGGQSCRIRRAWRFGTRGFVSVAGLDSTTPAQQLLAAILSETDETLFKNVFAVGLQELQELATLNDADVAGHVYGLSLGPEGQRLLDVTARVGLARDEFFDASTERGELADLLAHDEQLTRELQHLAPNRQRYSELCTRRCELESEIAELKTRQSGIRSQLKGHLFLKRVWGPWNDVRGFEAELADIPQVTGFPEAGTARLDELDERIAKVRSERTQTIEQLRALRATAGELRSSPKSRRQAAALRSLVDERGAIEAVGQSLSALDGEAREARQMLDLHLAELGDGWSVERLEKIDSSPAANFRGLQLARAYQTAAERRNRLRRRHDLLSKACQHQRLELAERLKSLGGASLDDEIATARQRLAQLETFGALQVRESELELQLSGMKRNAARLESRESLPDWVAFLLVFLLIAGGLIAALGLVSGLTLNGVAGAALVLVGVTGCGIAYGMKRHGDIETDEELELLREQTSAIEIQLRETREALANAECPGDSAIDPEAHGQPSVGSGDLIAAAARRLFELEQLGAVAPGIQARRRRLSERRQKIRESHRRLCDARQRWCEFVVGIGLPETVKVDEAFAAWQRVVEGRAAHMRWNQIEAECGRQRREWDRFQHRCEKLASELSCPIGKLGPLAMLDAFSRELHSREEKRTQRRGLLREIRQFRKRLRRLNAALADASRERSALLVKGGAANRDEFVERAAHVARRREIEELLAIARTELDSAASTEPNLAIVEEDLHDFDADENAEHIDVLEREQDDLEADLQQGYEQLGSIKQSIAEVEDDRRSTRLRCEQSHVRHELQNSVERWLGLNLAGRAVDAMRSQFERTCQPPTLAAAGEFLKQLTAGRYSTIWTPLGQRHLCIDDDRGNSLRVEQLSNGTREQLFLALRFAMVREFARKGVELPLVLDDILVNFDQERTEAAVDSLLKFVEDGQQVLLFTCHLHLAQHFASKGIEPTWLPAHEAAGERLAG